MLCCDGGAFKKQHDAGIIHPGAQNHIERVPAAAKVVIEVFLFYGTRAFVGEFVCLVANIQLGDVALFGELDALLVGKFPEAPKHASAAFAAMMEAVTASLQLAVVDREISLSS